MKYLREKFVSSKQMILLKKPNFHEFKRNFSSLRFIPFVSLTKSQMIEM